MSLLDAMGSQYFSMTLHVEARPKLKPVAIEDIVDRSTSLFQI
jgi:hypothetical protein